jgi:deoxyadenosine/deoxycytidine kinase
MFRVEVCGGIASGKTTLVRLLSRLDIHPVYEDFSRNPFYKAFYQDPSANAFETEITFLLQHFHEIREAAISKQPLCCDFSPVLDVAYADVTLKAKHRRVFTAVHREVKNIIGSPRLLIHLKCDSLEELRRIRKRRRASERVVTTDYLSALNTALARRVALQSKYGKVLEIDSGEADFAHDKKTRVRVTNMVLRALKA